ncbi:ABC-type multidrug transport system, ATPase component [Candidatus Burkholderia brachyanthoides]|nr:ABC-type multidrug transport system, ATPase component [Candidatus Burkholderia brachyanthoides]
MIVLDEPTAGVDVELRQTLWKFISRLNREGHTIVLTTHYLEEAESLCDRIAMLRRGKVVALERTSTLLQRFAGMQLYLRFARPACCPPNSARSKSIRTPLQARSICCVWRVMTTSSRFSRNATRPAVRSMKSKSARPTWKMYSCK